MANFYDFTALSLKHKEISMADYRGKVVLVVNTASKCGFTPQFAGLEELYKKYKDQGLGISLKLSGIAPLWFTAYFYCGLGPALALSALRYLFEGIRY